VPGQFVVLAFGGFAGWQRHPFSVSGAAGDRRLEVTIKSEGDYTRTLVDRLRPGVPAKLAGPFGGFDYRDGGREQIWIAAGIGITPFISWVRSLDGTFDRDVDLYYSVRRASEAVYRQELEAAAKQDPSLSSHIVCTETDGRLAIADVLRTVAPDTTPWIYMCGPPTMMQAFAESFRRAGVPAERACPPGASAGRSSAPADRHRAGVEDPKPVSRKCS
jgi:predicted ferric reductase